MRRTALSRVAACGAEASAKRVAEAPKGSWRPSTGHPHPRHKKRATEGSSHMSEAQFHSDSRDVAGPMKPMKRERWEGKEARVPFAQQKGQLGKRSSFSAVAFEEVLASQIEVTVEGRVVVWVEAMVPLSGEEEMVEVLVPWVAVEVLLEERVQVYKLAQLEEPERRLKTSAEIALGEYPSRFDKSRPKVEARSTMKGSLSINATLVVVM